MSIYFVFSWTIVLILSYPKFIAGFSFSSVCSCNYIFVYWRMIGFRHLVTASSPISFLFRAKKNVNVVPFCHSETHTISPPNCFTICFEMCRPSPIPFVFNSFVASRNPNSLKSFFWFSSVIPMPVSYTETWMQPCQEFLIKSLI